MITFSIIIPTVGRPTLRRTLESIVAAGAVPEDQVLIVGDGERPAARAIAADFTGRLPIAYFETPPTNCVGGPQRMAAIAIASRSHLVLIDDDDAYRPGALRMMRGVAQANPDRIALFRMHRNQPRYAGDDLWKFRDPFIGNVGTPMMMVPNRPLQLGIWARRAAGDFDFLESTLARWPGGKGSILWREEVVCDVY